MWSGKLVHWRVLIVLCTSMEDPRVARDSKEQVCNSQLQGGLLGRSSASRVVASAVAQAELQFRACGNMFAFSRTLLENLIFSNKIQPQCLLEKLQVASEAKR